MLREIGDYLAFFDKVSLSLTSKTCRAKLGAFDPPDYTSWAAYLCINAHIYPSDQQVYLLPDFDLRLLKIYTFLMDETSPLLDSPMALLKLELLEYSLILYYCYFPAQEWLKNANVGGLRLMKPIKLNSSDEATPWNQSSASYKPDLLLRPYFPRLKYPENTLAHLYLRHMLEVSGRKGT